MQLREIGEFGLIDKIKRRTKTSDPSIIKGIGDDCAVIKASKKQVLLLTCDLLLEGIHFNLKHTDSYHLGKKALAVNLSDIAAMGGIPRFYLVSLGLPSYLHLAFVESLYQGMEEVAQEFKVSLIGGNVSSSKNIIIDLTLIGEIKPQEIVYRNGSQAGDAIFVTGTLGDSALGLTMLTSTLKLKNTSGVQRLKEKHLSPCPRVQAGRLLATHQVPTAMIDLSDGLISDLKHILNESRKGAEVWTDKIPLSPEFIKYSKLYKANGTDLALTGGEDYELLFTVPPHKLKRVNQLSRQLSLPLTMIGKINGEKGKILFLKENGEKFRIKGEGFHHF